MTQRFLPLVLALLVAGAPIAAEICQVTCAEAQAGRSIHHSTHDQSCHHAKGASARPSIVSAPHPCGNSHGMPAISAVAARAINAVPFLTLVPFDTAASALSLDTTSSTLGDPPSPRESILPPSNTPLRL